VKAPRDKRMLRCDNGVRTTSQGNGVKALRVIGCLSILVFATAVNAGDCVRDQYGNVVCGGGQCATDQYGKVLCARDGGGAIRDRFGVVRCGVGKCATDDNGRVMCSTQPGGGALKDSYGEVKCLGACAEGTEQRCEPAR